MRLLTVTIVVVIAAFAIKFAQLMTKRISEKYSYSKKIQLSEPLLIMLVWIAVIFWSIYYLFYEKPYYYFVVIALILILLLSISWFFVKDYMAGIAFKMQNNYQPGDIVQLGSTGGKLENLLLTHISIYTKEGKLIKIPYSKLSNEIISSKTTGSSFDNTNYLLRIPKKFKVEEARKMIENILFNSPWRIVNKLPSVKLKSELPELFEFEIQFETRNEKHFNYVIQHLRERFGRN